jgi:hypothetical protein
VDREEGHMSDAETYNRIRRIVFSTFHDPSRGPSVAKQWLENYASKLGVRAYKGLKAEVAFYEQHRRSLGLTVAGDMGEHADFSGILDAQACRFDVATTLDFKKWSDYEPHMGNGSRYKIALLNHDNFELVDVLDLGFPRCRSCGEGHLIPCIALLNQNYNRHGESTLTNDQLLLDVCTSCDTFQTRQRFTHSGLFSPQELADSLSGMSDEDDFAYRAAHCHSIDMYKYFRRQADDMLMAVAQHGYVVTEPDGGGHWAIQMTFVNEAVQNELPQFIETEPEI